METSLAGAPCAGVFVEFFDDRGHLIGQALCGDWRRESLPGVGDSVEAFARLAASGKRRQLAGRVKARYFELQHDDRGRPCVWVRLDVVPDWSRRRPTPRPRPDAPFSVN